ncbi:DNA-binding MarR family transcriptional regulator [Methylohalomonas lacus]|uniref:DNA-binding MarR family transcriptional regulator n=1 Tax=Methylohalomonas lacus TaxID=398773 RepID=A0AAE3HMZ4_9GAMM|nr:MarR family transcriptional regulator [Methylohalomonas lacus]MCS3904353.1 DNA-binding MarR family transcriptional regulator [Methylohalomonas lacus]
MSENHANQNFGCLLHDTARLLRRDFNRRAQKLGLTQTQWQALCVLSRNEGINQATLAELLEVQPITLGRLVDRLEATGWVERRAHPTDRRATTLYLTAKAEPILLDMGKLAEETRELALQDVSDAECNQIMQVLERIKANLLSQEESTGNPAQRRAQ